MQVQARGTTVRQSLPAATATKCAATKYRGALSRAGQNSALQGAGLVKYPPCAAVVTITLSPISHSGQGAPAEGQKQEFGGHSNHPNCCDSRTCWLGPRAMSCPNAIPTQRCCGCTLLECAYGANTKQAQNPTPAASENPGFTSSYTCYDTAYQLPFHPFLTPAMSHHHRMAFYPAHVDHISPFALPKPSRAPESHRTQAHRAT